MTAAWQVNPRSKMTDPVIAKAYKAKTLRLITLDFGAYIGYSWTVDADRTVDDLLNDPLVGRSYRKAKTVTIAPYPYHLEQR
jgi:hypothetical protein